MRDEAMNPEKDQDPDRGPAASSDSSLIPHPSSLPKPKLIGLVRVSTDKQGESGLGLDAQLAAIEADLALVGGELIKTYVEVESGMHDDVDKPTQLRAAAGHAAFARPAWSSPRSTAWSDSRSSWPTSRSWGSSSSPATTPM